MCLYTDLLDYFGAFPWPPGFGDGITLETMEAKFLNPRGDMAYAWATYNTTTSNSTVEGQPSPRDDQGKYVHWYSCTCPYSYLKVGRGHRSLLTIVIVGDDLRPCN